jgi:acetoacetyl-CoA synthetase
MTVPEMAVAAVEVLWRPRPDQIELARLTAYMRWLASNKGLRFDDYEAMWQWSVGSLEEFWQTVWDYFDVQADGSCDPVLRTSTMPGAQWFPNARLNYAEHVFRCASQERPALIARSEDTGTHQVSWSELKRDTGALAARLRALGVGPGDRVASYMPNRPETVVAFLACASLGAIWSSCSPDMGATVVLDRFRQIEPKVLLAVDSYSYNGKIHDRREVVDELLQSLPTVRDVIHVAGPICRAASHKAPAWRDRLAWAEMIAQDAELQFERLPFEHPLWIVYSSGTTGLPKAIVHSQGGIVLTHLKTMALQHDLRPADRLLFLGGTGWIVWNLQLGALFSMTATPHGPTKPRCGASSMNRR